MAVHINHGRMFGLQAEGTPGSVAPAWCPFQPPPTHPAPFSWVYNCCGGGGGAGQVSSSDFQKKASNHKPLFLLARGGGLATAPITGRVLDQNPTRNPEGDQQPYP